MKILIDYIPEDNTAVFHNIDVRIDVWETLFRNISTAFSTTEAVRSGADIVMPWRLFLRTQKSLRGFYYGFDVIPQYSEKAKEAIEKAEQDDYEHAKAIQPITQEDLISKLAAVGFTRKLTNNQLSNVEKIAKMPNAATFSVPGAGKTTEALAFFYYNAKQTDRLLVVAPKNALISWDKELKECVKDCKDSFVRLQDGEERIKTILAANPRFMIITYQQFPRVKDVLARYLTNNNVFVFLDESHRIKAGVSGTSAKSILDISPLPIRKMILSGTPMPQSKSDLTPQFSFLYPEHYVSDDTVIDLFGPIFVRTTANQLGIPKIIYQSVTVDMSPLQRKVYDSLKSAVKRELETFNLSDFSRDTLQKIGKSVMKVLQFVSNPSLLSMDLGYAFNADLSRVLAESDGPKLTKTLKLARDITKTPGEKVVIWSSFIKNVELISYRLGDLGANYIDGSVPTGDSNDPATREYRINKFLTDPSSKILVANPAACSESISLHTACHNAIYLDRSFNAAHFMQSEDRIHRLGLTANPVIYIVECEDSVDQVVDKRLKEKIANMSQALSDPSIVISDFETNSEEDDSDDAELEDEDYMNGEDAKALLKYFFGMPC